MFPVSATGSLATSVSTSLLGRLARVAFVLCAGATALAGCPLYSDCDDRDDCASGYYCSQFSRRCVLNSRGIECVRPSECGPGETCTPEFVCRPGSCDFHGCVDGYRCGVVDSAHTCVSEVADAGPVDASLPAEPADAAATDPLDASSGDAGDAATDASP